jgi:hypothetical protein
MIEYEYITEGFVPVGEFKKLEQWLNHRGEEGWQLVGFEPMDKTKHPYVSYSLVFMRKLEKAPAEDLVAKYSNKILELDGAEHLEQQEIPLILSEMLKEIG